VEKVKLEIIISMELTWRWNCFPQI